MKKDYRPRLVAAGVATCAAGVFGAPWFLIDYGFLSSAVGPLGTNLFRIGDPLLLGYAAFELRRLVRAEDQFDRLLLVFILIEIAQAGLAVLDLLGVKLEGLVGLRIVLIVALGINLVWLGTAFIGLKPNLFRLMKPLGILCMATGFMMTTLFWVPLALIPATLAKLVAATTFFLAARAQDREHLGTTPSDHPA